MGIEKPNQENNPLPRERLNQENIQPRRQKLSTEQLIELAKIAGMSKKKLERIMRESAEDTERRLGEKEQWEKNKERRKLMEDTQTFDPRTMGRAGGVRQIKSGGRTPIGTVEDLKE